MKVLVVGYGLSGVSAKEFLEHAGYTVYIAKKEDIDASGFCEKYLDRLFDGLSFIVKSPGIDGSIELIKQAKIRKIKIAVIIK